MRWAIKRNPILRPTSPDTPSYHSEHTDRLKTNKSFVVQRSAPPKVQEDRCQKYLVSDLQGADIPVSLSITSTDGAALSRAEDRAAESI